MTDLSCSLFFYLKSVGDRSSCAAASGSWSSLPHFRMLGALACTAVTLGTISSLLLSLGCSCWWPLKWFSIHLLLLLLSVSRSDCVPIAHRALCSLQKNASMLNLLSLWFCTINVRKIFHFGIALYEMDRYSLVHLNLARLFNAILKFLIVTLLGIL